MMIFLDGSTVARTAWVEYLRGLPSEEFNKLAGSKSYVFVDLPSRVTAAMECAADLESRVREFVEIAKEVDLYSADHVALFPSSWISLVVAYVMRHSGVSEESVSLLMETTLKGLGEVLEPLRYSDRGPLHLHLLDNSEGSRLTGIVHTYIRGRKVEVTSLDTEQAKMLRHFQMAVRMSAADSTPPTGRYLEIINHGNRPMA